MDCIMNTVTIDGVVFKELDYHTDNRGWLIELYREDESYNGIQTPNEENLSATHIPAMIYISQTEPGVTRGPHEHQFQTDYFAFIGPGLFNLYLWDARKNSNTYGNKMKMKCGENRPCAVIIPPGVVHAYKNVSDRSGWVLNAPDKLYAGRNKQEQVDEIRHEHDKNTEYLIDD